MSFSSSPIREQPPAIFRHMQPSSPVQYEEDLPSDVDISFASSMSISMSPTPSERPHLQPLQPVSALRFPSHTDSRPLLSPIMDASPMDISPVPTPFLQVPKRPALAMIQPMQKENAPPEQRDYFTHSSSKKQKRSTISKHQQQEQSSPFALPPARKFGTDIRNLPRSSQEEEGGEGKDDLRSSKSGKTRGSLPAHWVQGTGQSEKRMGGLYDGEGAWDVNNGLPSSSPARGSDRMDIDMSSPALASPAPASQGNQSSDTYMSPPPAIMAVTASNLSDLSGLYESSDVPSSPLATFSQQPRSRKPSPRQAQPKLLKALLPSPADLPSSSPPTSPTVALKARKLEKFATAGPGSLLFGGGSGHARGSSFSVSRRAHPYAHARRPSINPAAPDRDAHTHRSVLPAPQSAFSILTQDPEGSAKAGPPSVLGPMRRALSMAGAQEASSSDVEAECSSPLMAAQRAYAKRTHSRLVTRADGSPAFRPLRQGTEPAPMSAIDPPSSSSSISKRESCPAQPSAPRGSNGLGQPFAGFGHNEQEGKILPCHKVKDDGLMRITPETLEQVLNGDYDHQLQALHIVDCRFDYEFAGGHVDGAVNLGTTEAVEEYFLHAGCGLPLPSPSRSGELLRSEQGEEEKKTVIIFHCEFSVKRAPTIAKHLRSKDRAMNAHCYPKVHFPEVYVLQGGYYDFFKRCPSHCEPKGYVAMLDPRHAGALSPSLGQFRQGAKWQRARSYTYGDHTMQRPKSIAQPPALPFAAGAAAAAAVKKRRAPAQPLTSVREDPANSSSEDAFGSLGDSPCPRISLPQPARPQVTLTLDQSRPRSLGMGVSSGLGITVGGPGGRTGFERAVSFRQ